MSFQDTLTKLLVQQLESMLSVPPTPVPPTPVPSTTQTTSVVNFADPPATRHLLLVETKDNISRNEIAIAKFDRVDVIYVSRETLSDVADKMKQFNIKWRSINMLFHGSADLEEESISVFGIKMSMNRNIMMADPNVQGMINFTKAGCKYTDDSLYVYTCAVGVVNGLKELCLRLDKECNLKSGIFLSTNITGNGVGQDWNIEWGTKYGFLTSGVHTNEIEHASVALFRDIKKLTFILADPYPVTITKTMIDMNNTNTNMTETIDALSVATDKLNNITVSLDNLSTTTYQINAAALSLSDLTTTANQLNNTASSLRGLTNTANQLNNTASSLSGLTNTANQLNNTASSLSGLTNTANQLSNAVSSLDGLANTANQLNNTASSLSGLTNTANQLSNATSTLGDLSSTVTSLDNVSTTLDSWTGSINNVSVLLNTLIKKNISLGNSVSADIIVDALLQKVSIAPTKGDSAQLLYDINQTIDDKMRTNGNQRLSVNNSTITTLNDYILSLNPNNSIDINLINQYKLIFSKLNVI